MAITKAKLPEFNILLLGETGAGKSTTINALANYFNYDNFETASKWAKNFDTVVPSKIMLPNPETGTEMLIESNECIGNKANERGIVGSSNTISTAGYTIKFGHAVLRIIDTPGIGDTSGAEQDKINFEDIMNYLQQYSQLHAVVFVMKGDSSRNTPFFKYCFTELLTHLHRSVSANIFFLFTHSRNTLYGAGEGYASLKNFLQTELENQVDLTMEPGKNCFFIDNEAFRFLLAKKMGYSVPRILELSSMESWEQSVRQIGNMMEHIMCLEPHNLQQTISLNNARKIIIEFAQPMVEMQKNIEENIKIIESRKKSLDLFNESLEELSDQLKFEIYDLKVEQLTYASTVCASARCTEVVTTNGVENVTYPERCHEKCQCMFVSANVPKQVSILTCEAMELVIKKRNIFLRDFSRNCKKCKCNWSQHMHIYSRYEKVVRVALKAEIEEKIQSREKMIEFAEKVKKQAEELVQELKSEIDIIEDCNAKFAYILSTNSQLTHNKYYETYLTFLINEEMKKKNPKTEVLEKMKQNYQHKIAQLTKAINCNKSKEARVSIDDVPRLKDKLFNLKLSGDQFKQILNANRVILDKLGRNFDKEVANVSVNNLFYKLAKKILK